MHLLTTFQDARLCVYALPEQEADEVLVAVLPGRGVAAHIGLSSSGSLVNQPIPQRERERR